MLQLQYSNSTDAKLEEKYDFIDFFIPSSEN